MLLSTQAIANNQITVLDRYICRISQTDHYNSHGQRLKTVSSIIRQERANFHKGIRDPDDLTDQGLDDPMARASLEKMVEDSQITNDVKDRIINGTPLIYIVLSQNSDGNKRIDISLLD